MTMWTLAVMAELRNSICRDLDDQQLLAFITRLRQPEELYIRTLYALFIATEKELHHILSGEMPNSFSGLYSRVNEVVFEGRGLLLASQVGLKQGSFTPMDTLNEGAHVSYKTFMTCMGWARNREYIPSADAYRNYLTKYCDYLHYMHEMFKAGKDKKDVLAGVINLHKPASYWKTKPVHS